MKLYVKGWMGKLPFDDLKQEAIVINEENGKEYEVEFVEINSLEEFIAKYGPMIISPPGFHPYPEGWFAWYNNGKSRFGQS